MSNPYSSPTSTDHPDPNSALDGELHGMKIITIAMLAGVLVFLGISLMLSQGELGTEPEILSWVGIGFFALMLIQQLIIPPILTRNALKAISSESLRQAEPADRLRMVLPAFRTSHIVACAMIEGAAFLNIVVYIIDKFVGNLAAAAVGVVVLALKLPTSTKVQWWAEERVREIEMR